MVYVDTSTTDMKIGMMHMMAAMCKDYAMFMPIKDDITRKMNEEYVSGITYKTGNKYIKLFNERGGVLGFVVNVDNDKKFEKGDILKAAGYNAPARNFARGNILKGGYNIMWTGA
jgi:hypothetical protein